MTRYTVALTQAAARDLELLYEYIAEHDSAASANRLLDRLEEVSASLAGDPARGTIPRELGALGITEYRQVFFKPYRLIYRVYSEQVVIFIIADGRRDMQTLLASRLLSP